jgi:hypothetical protein
LFIARIPKVSTCVLVVKPLLKERSMGFLADVTLGTHQWADKNRATYGE